MKRQFYNNLILILVIIGIILIISSQGLITGYAVSISFISQKVKFFFGFVFVLIAVVLFIGVKRKSSRLEKLIGEEPKEKEKKRHILEKKLHLRPYEAARLIRGEDIQKEIITPDYQMLVGYALRNDRLSASVIYVGGKTKTKKYQEAAKPGLGMRALSRFKDTAIKTGKIMGIKEVDVYGLGEHNRRLFRFLRKRGYEDTVYTSVRKNPRSGELEGHRVEGVLKRYHLKPKKKKAS